MPVLAPVIRKVRPPRSDMAHRREAIRARRERLLESVAMRVLLTNDDGIWARGLGELRDALLGLDELELAVVAPSSNRSATARSITTRSPLSVDEVEFPDGG